MRCTDSSASRPCELQRTGIAGKHAHLQRRKRSAGIAIAHLGQELQGIVVQMHVLLAEARVLIGQRTAKERFDVVDTQRLELEHPAAADQRAIHGEERIGGGRADERDDTFFNIRQKRVLLRLVEAMDFVDEQQRAQAAAGELVARLFQNLAKFLHAAGHRAELHESPLAAPWQAVGPAWFCPCPADHRRSPSPADRP